MTADAGRPPTNDEPTRSRRSGAGSAVRGERRTKAVTPPKGRPTAGRRNRRGSARLFGPTAQWISVGILVALVVAVLITITDGGDVDPLDDDQPSPFGAILPGVDQ